MNLEVRLVTLEQIYMYHMKAEKKCDKTFCSDFLISINRAVNLSKREVKSAKTVARERKELE